MVNNKEKCQNKDELKVNNKLRSIILNGSTFPYILVRIQLL